MAWIRCGAAEEEAEAGVREMIAEVQVGVVAEDEVDETAGTETQVVRAEILGTEETGTDPGPVTAAAGPIHGSAGRLADRQTGT